MNPAPHPPTRYPIAWPAVGSPPRTKGFAVRRCRAWGSGRFDLGRLAAQPTAPSAPLARPNPVYRVGRWEPAPKARLRRGRLAPMGLREGAARAAGASRSGLRLGAAAPMGYAFRGLRRWGYAFGASRGGLRRWCFALRASHGRRQGFAVGVCRRLSSPCVRRPLRYRSPRRMRPAGAIVRICASGTDCKAIGSYEDDDGRRGGAQLRRGPPRSRTGGDHRGHPGREASRCDHLRARRPGPGGQGVPGQKRKQGGHRLRGRCRGGQGSGRRRDEEYVARRLIFATCALARYGAASGDQR
ncbi:unnamed protein product [[Actinomadura] parvosata subsp. kistnae]|nr:unnamed protein product [Actinomadura parvosata subsp. kistnae]